jgi:hypothetical protein
MWQMFWELVRWIMYAILGWLGITGMTNDQNNQKTGMARKPERSECQERLKWLPTNLELGNLPASVSQ